MQRDDAPTQLTPEICRASRALLGWTIDDLDRHSEVAPNTIIRIEGGMQAKEETIGRLRAALIRAGIEYFAGGWLRRASDAQTDRRAA